MTALGVCVNVTGELPGAAELAGLGISGGWLRTPVQGDIALLENLSRLPPSVNVCVTLNNECTQVGGDWNGWEDTLRRIRRDYSGRIQAVECGNELDRFPDTPASFAADLVRRAMPILRPAGILTIATSVAGGDWPGYLTRLYAECGGAQPDAYNAHFYGKGFDGLHQQPYFGSIESGINDARALVGGWPLAMTEGGVKVGEVGGEVGQSAYVRRWVELVRSLSSTACPFACYFALSDRTGAPSEQGASAFGLRDPNGHARPAWAAFATAAGGSGSVVPVKPQPTPAGVTSGPNGAWIGGGLLAAINARGLTPITGEIGGESGTAVVYCVGGVKVRWNVYDGRAYIEKMEAA